MPHYARPSATLPCPGGITDPKCTIDSSVHYDRAVAVARVQSLHRRPWQAHATNCTLFITRTRSTALPPRHPQVCKSFTTTRAILRIPLKHYTTIYSVHRYTAVCPMYPRLNHHTTMIEPTRYTAIPLHVPGNRPRPCL